MFKHLDLLHYMKIQEELTDQIKKAMKEKKPEVLDALRGLQAALKNKNIELQRELEDSEVIDVMKTASKQLKDAMADFVKGEREDLVEKTKKELELIAQFLPKPLEREEIRKHVVSLAADIGAQTMADMGKLMGAVMKAVGAAANGEDVKAEVEDYLKE